MAQIIYVLTNEAMPNIVKIGMTNGDSVESRISQLSLATGVPLPFECYFAAEVEDCSKLEKALHQLFADTRINPRREFFKIDPEKVVLAISIGNFREVTPGYTDIDSEELQALDKAKARRSKFNLDAVGVKPGAELTLSRDEAITCTVVDSGRVSYKGEVMSLSAAALKALQSKGYTTPAASGPGYWMYEGETLGERRRRMEEEQYGDSTVD
ncbi:GIY-YIG nuclease family protein [Burkholderia guangdongensis]|uniref:GIY-YIG nuclease family protein n=1 Tax=Burkholderia guangdongensis TaxID=1792500 RepID=UPI0015C9747A|nr:GIY-YIG nuclease family protein [Burkholderia guangdongensis]